MPESRPGSNWNAVYRVVRRIPEGQVATYGQVAELAGMPRAARQVGWALHALPADSDDVPWHRVVNARGEVSPRSERVGHDLQRALLEAEGVSFGLNGRLDWDQVAWRPGTRKTSAKSRTKKTKTKTGNRP